MTADFKILIKQRLFGWLIDYHLKKCKKYDKIDYLTLRHFHIEKAKYYYEKIHGVPFSKL